MASEYRDDLQFLEPQEGSKILKPLICSKCEYETEAWVSQKTPQDGRYAKCPECKKGFMIWNISGMNVTVKSRGPGVSETKYGQKRKREMLRRSEELRTKQWDNVQPISPMEGVIARNPTPGGPLDPNGPFQPKQREKTIFTENSATPVKGKKKPKAVD